MRTRFHIAADGLNLDQTVKLMRLIGANLASVKIHDLFDELGQEAVDTLQDAGAQGVWIDYKLHDIPKTVKKRAEILARTGATAITVHIDDIDMMHAALESELEVYGVTVLTSIREADVHLLTGLSPTAAVLYRARLAKLAGLHGIVCSALEVGELAKRRELQGLKLIVPGTRSKGVALGDQQRVDTPEAAVRAGATDLVIGSEVTGSDDPVAAFENIQGNVMQAEAESL